MVAVTGFLFAFAVLAIVGAGFATIVGLSVLRDRCFAVAIVAVLAALAVQLVVEVIGAVTTGAEPLHARENTPVLGLTLVMLGHAVLGAALLRRRGRHHADGGADELEQARGRGRPRLSPEGEEP